MYILRWAIHSGYGAQLTCQLVAALQSELSPREDCQAERWICGVLRQVSSWEFRVEGEAVRRACEVLRRAVSSTHHHRSRETRT